MVERKEDLSPYGYIDDPFEYFRRDGEGKSKLTKAAALAVCDMLSERGVFVQGLDAGYWRHPGYEERSEYGYYRFPRYHYMSVRENNNFVKAIILEECDDLDAFVISELRD